MSAKKRKHKLCIQYGFVSVIIHSEKKPQCVLCNKVLFNDSMRPAKLKQHLENVHPQHINKNKTYFERQRRALKSMRLDASSDFFRKNNQRLEASYLVAFEIDNKKSHILSAEHTNQTLYSENDWDSARKRGRKKASCNFAVK